MTEKKLKLESLFIKLITLFALLWISAINIVLGQTNQVWADYVLNVPFANSYLFDTEFSYRTLLTKQDKWRSISISPDIERSISNRVDVMVTLRTAFTQQETNYNTFELTPILGMRYHFTPYSRVLLRGLFRAEYRNLYHKETSSWEHSTRTRFRAESIIPINRKSYFENNLWYALLDAELFWVIDQQLDERFANQLRWRVGVGYRLSYDWRFEFIYTDQFTRDNLAGDLEETSNVFRVRIKHFLNASKPAKQEPNDN